MSATCNPAMPIPSLAVSRIVPLVDPTAVLCSTPSVLHAKNTLNAHARGRRQNKETSLKKGEASKLALDFLRGCVLPWNYVYTISVRGKGRCLRQDPPKMGSHWRVACETDDHQPTLLYG